MEPIRHAWRQLLAALVLMSISVQGSRAWAHDEEGGAGLEKRLAVLEHHLEDLRAEVGGLRKQLVSHADESAFHKKDPPAAGKTDFLPDKELLAMAKKFQAVLGQGRMKEAAGLHARMGERLETLLAAGGKKTKPGSREDVEGEGKDVGHWKGEKDPIKPKEGKFDPFAGAEKERLLFQARLKLYDKDGDGKLSGKEEAIERQAMLEEKLKTAPEVRKSYDQGGKRSGEGPAVKEPIKKGPPVKEL